MTNTDLIRFMDLNQTDLNGYNAQSAFNKDDFHRLGKKLCKEIATQLGLAPGTFEIRSNKGGIAVCGEITLHSEHLYIQFGQTMKGCFMWRTCRGMKDYTGGPNQWMPYSDLIDLTYPLSVWKKSLMQPV